MKDIEKLRKLIRETYIKKKLKDSLKEAIQKLFEKDKEFMEEVKSVMMDNAEPAVAPTTKPAPTTTPSPSPRPDPRHVPNPGIKTTPKAQHHSEAKKKINEDMMQYSDDFRERPHPDNQKKISDKSDPNATPLSDIGLFKKGEENHNTQERIASKEFEELLRKSEEVGKLSPMEIFELVQKVSRLEENHKARLEKLAKKIIQKELGLSQDIMDNISAQLLTQKGHESVIKDFDIDPKTGKPFKEEDEDEEDGESDFSSGNPQEHNDEEGQEDGEDNESPLQKLGLSKEDADILVGEVQVRKIMNSMIMGGGYKLFDVLKDFKAELDSIDRRLYPSYIALNPNANLMHWMMPPNNIGGRRAAGSVKLTLVDPSENDDEDSEEQGQQNGQRPQQPKPKEEKQEGDIEIPKVSKVEAKATNFAVLLHELAKGALEYLFAIRLAGFNKNLRRAITNVADDYEAEHFHKLLGPQIWKQFFYGVEVALEQYCERHELYGLNNNREMLPLVINKISTLKTQDFVDLVDDLLNPGEAEKNRRQPPLERIKAIINAINTDIKEFMDEQDGHGGDINLGEPNSNLDHAIQQNKQSWIDDLEHKVTQDDEPEEEEAPAPQTNAGNVDYNSMSKIDLADALAQALEDEDYQLAAKLRDIIKNKVN